MGDIYIVSGFMRSGTSMMMQALEAGGLEAAYNPDRDKLNDRHGDNNYKINEHFYELSRADYMHPNFPDNYENKLIKCLWTGMLNIKGSDNTKHIVFMRRPIEEIQASYEAAFGHKHPQTIPELADKLDRICSILAQRRDVVVSEVQYHDVLTNPLKVFKDLAYIHWPINPEKAAVIVDPSKYRHRK